MGGIHVINNASTGNHATAVTIRGVEGCDRAGLCAIIDASANLSEEERDCAKELLDIYLDDADEEDYLFLAAFSAPGPPLGFVCYGMASLADAVYDLYWIIVDPAHRRTGVAAKLLKTVEKILKGRGARLLVAETSGLPAYAPARGFYERNGFKEEARVEGFYKPEDDLVIYVKRF
jgi:ribosomal protein S18 acetylase RimI-like enzyme